jgi:outer membrane receptor for ferrienterochelin and colicin
LVLAAGAIADPGVVRADERTEARRAFRAGMQAIAEGQYDAGIAQLELAYDVLPHPNVIYNIGLAHMYAGRSEQAIAYFERYKESVPPAQAAEVDTLIAGLKQSTPQGATAGQTPQAAGGEAGDGAALATAAAEIRRIGQETANPALIAQADSLDRLAAEARASSAEPAGTEPTAAQAQPAPAAPRPRPPLAADKSDAYDETVVSAARFASSPLDAPYSTAIITAQDIRMTGLTSIPDLLRRVAGVDIATVTPGHAEVAIRGLNRRTSNKVLFLVDGRSRRLDFLGVSWLDQVSVSPEDIERIEIIRGPASQMYGADAFSGVVNIITRAPGVGRPFVAGGFGSNGRARAVGSFSGRDKQLAYRVGFGHDETDNAVRAVGQNRVDITSYGDPIRAYERSWASGELRYTFKPGLEASVGASGGYFRTHTVQGLSRLLQVTASDNVQSNLYATLTTPVGIKVSTYWDRAHGNANASAYAPGSIDVEGRRLRQDVADVDVQLSRTFKLLVPNQFTIGGGYRFKGTNWAWFDGPQEQHHYAAYLSDVLTLAKPLSLHLGARLDRHPVLKDLQFSPRAALVYRFLEGQSLRASVGRAFRGPTFLESYLVLPNPTPERGVTGLGVGNTKLDPEVIVSYELGYLNQASDYLSIEANVYYNSVRDAILFTSVDRFTLRDFSSGSGFAEYEPNVQAFPISTLSFTNERASFDQLGGELGARVYPVKGLDFYANYAVHDTSPHDKGKIDPVRAKQRPTSLHKVNAGIQYRAPFGLDSALDVSWYSKQLWVEQVVDIDSGGVRFQAFDQSSFVMLNARLGMRLWADRLELGVVGTNLANGGKRQHPFGQPIDTRVLGTAKLRF